MKTSTTWKTGQNFESVQNGHKIEISGNAGFSPKALLLSGLSGCTGIDVVDLLEKMRVPFADLTVDAEAEQTAEHPRVFTTIHLTFRVKTEASQLEKVRKAIDLSLDKYCGVAAMLKKNSRIEYEIVITG
jgi:putative redox protein